MNIKDMKLAVDKGIAYAYAIGYYHGRTESLQYNDPFFKDGMDYGEASQAYNIGFDDGFHDYVELDNGNEEI